MPSPPKVSVFMAVYQQEHILRESIDSVLAQDYENLEIVIGDDGSTDGTGALLREYDRKYPGRFKLIFVERNTGITANCNRILAQCTGNLIAWFSGDDIWMPAKTRRQVQWFEEHPEAVICYTNTEIFDGRTGRTLRLQHTRHRDPFRSGGVEQLFVSASFFNGISVMARSSAVPRHGYDPRLAMVSDWLFWVETAHNGSIGYIEEVLARYRVHQDNVSKRLGAMLSEQLLALGIVESKYPELTVYTPRMRTDLLFGCGIEHLKAGNVEQAGRFFRYAVGTRFLGSAYARFPFNVLAVLLAKIRVLGLAWRVWLRFRERIR